MNSVRASAASNTTAIASINQRTQQRWPRSNFEWTLQVCHTALNLAHRMITCIDVVVLLFACVRVCCVLGSAVNRGDTLGQARSFQTAMVPAAASLPRPQRPVQRPPHHHQLILTLFHRLCGPQPPYHAHV